MDCSNASYFDVYSYFDSLSTFDIFYPRSKLFRKASKILFSIDRVCLTDKWSCLLIVFETGSSFHEYRMAWIYKSLPCQPWYCRSWMLLCHVLWQGKNLWLHRCWWRMLTTNCVGDNYKMLVTVLAILVTNIHYLFTLASGTNIQKMSPTSQNRDQL